MNFDRKRIQNTRDVFFRNFEALKRAEEQLERDDLARKEVFLPENMFWTTLDNGHRSENNLFCFQELENNPMKLLEERTAASKHEMDLAESLEELKELNRRCDFLFRLILINIDFSKMRIK